MLRKKLAIMMAAALMALMALGGPAFAQVTHPFCGSGQEYAQEHVVGLAQAQQIMAPEAGGVHNPGLAHQGFRVCEPPPGD